MIASQIDLHKRYGGVVPEIASRRHVEVIMPVIDQSLAGAGCSLEDIGSVAVTCGPGLVGGLLVGLSAAKAIAFALGIPLIGVNHVEGHIYANVLAHPELEPPVVCLTVSGGHTDLLLIDEFGSYKLLGRTRDDAAGEAFDKIARYVGLGYPGGPEIDRLAASGDPNAIRFPRGLSGAGDGYDFSFSGLKTAAINFVHNAGQKDRSINTNDFAASFQQAVVDVLVEKSIKAALEHKVASIILSGGVAANSRLRADLTAQGSSHGISVHYPPLSLCTDNAAMIASAGYFRLRRDGSSPLSLNAYPALKLGQPIA